VGEVYIRLPATCPVCQAEALTPFRVEAVLDALDDACPLRLFALCHGKVWDANPREIQQIRDFLSATINFSRRSEPWLNICVKD